VTVGTENMRVRPQFPTHQSAERPIRATPDPYLLEMIRGEPNPSSGGRNEEFTELLIGYRKCGKNFTEGQNEGEIKGQIRVVLNRFHCVRLL